MEDQPLVQDVDVGLEFSIMTTMSSFQNLQWGDAPQPWGATVEVLRSHQTNDELILGHPRDSLIAKRHAWNRSTNYSKNVDYSWSGGIANQMRWKQKTVLNWHWCDETGFDRLSWDEFREINWKSPAKLKYDGDVSPKTTRLVDWSDEKDGGVHAVANPDLTEKDMSKNRDSRNEQTSNSSRSSYSDDQTLDHDFPLDYFLQIQSKSNTEAPIIGHPMVSSDAHSETQESIHEVSNEGFTPYIDYLETEAARRRKFGELKSSTSASPITTSECEQPEEGGVQLGVPLRGDSLINLQMLQAGLESKNRRMTTFVSDVEDKENKESEEEEDEDADEENGDEEDATIETAKTARYSVSLPPKLVELHEGVPASGGRRFWRDVRAKLSFFSC